jgi:hypothetical protein
MNGRHTRIQTTKDTSEPQHCVCPCVSVCCLCAQFKVSDKSALVVYPETHEEEWVNLAGLVTERCIAVGKCACVSALGGRG